MKAENVMNEFENGGWQEEAKQTINDCEKMNELKNKKNKYLNIENKRFPLPFVAIP